MNIKHAILLFILLAIIGCTRTIPHLKLEDYQYEKANIKNGTEVEILSYSGGYNCTPSITYYHSIIVRDTVSKDTFRILSACPVLSDKFRFGTFNTPSLTLDSLLRTIDKTSPHNSSLEKYVILNSNEPFQQEKYKAIIGSLGFKDDNNDIAKEEFMKNNIDTAILQNLKKLN